MARAINIICSESGAEDRTSGRVSLFNIVDKIQFRKLPSEAKGVVVVPVMSLWIIATWMREQKDLDREFEFEVFIHIPGSDSPLPAAKGEFVFEKDFQRIVIRSMAGLPLIASGIMRIESRIRPFGETIWLNQEIPIPVEEVIDQSIQSAG